MRWVEQAMATARKKPGSPTMTKMSYRHYR